MASLWPHELDIDSHERTFAGTRPNIHMTGKPLAIVEQIAFLQVSITEDNMFRLLLRLCMRSDYLFLFSIFFECCSNTLDTFLVLSLTATFPGTMFSY